MEYNFAGTLCWVGRFSPVLKASKGEDDCIGYGSVDQLRPSIEQQPFVTDFNAWFSSLDAIIGALGQVGLGVAPSSGPERRPDRSQKEYFNSKCLGIRYFSFLLYNLLLVLQCAVS